jgi:hypothetical protein
MCIPRIFVYYYNYNYYYYYYYLYQKYIYIKILNYIRNASTCFAAFAPSLANAKSKLPEDGSEAPKHVGACVI